jgi:hypothetical protein
MQAPLEPGTVESQLLAYLKRLERNYYDWRAVHLHLSQLKPHNRRDYQLRVAASEFDGLLRQFDSELFQLRTGDLVYIWHGGKFAEVDQVILRLRYLFSDDPLAHEAAADAEPVAVDADLRIERDVDRPLPGKLCTWFDLEREFDTFRFHLEDSFQAADQARRGGTSSGAPLDPARLAKIEAQLASLNFAGLIRRQPVCALLPKVPPQPLFAEIHVAIRELGNALVPGIDLTADPWLFQRLAESLDRRLLTGLAKDAEVTAAGAISVNLRLATLLSPEFLKFDHAYRQRSKAPVIVELQLIDIFAELGGYLFIREFIRDRGYLVCIDGLHYLHLPLIDRKRLGADLVKFIWSPDLRDTLNPAQREELKAAIKRAGTDRVILCRCDTAEAIEWGHTVGIRLFQGHYVDARLRAARPPAIAAARQALRSSTAS